MDVGRIASLYGIFSGSLMIVTWIMLLGAGMVPELETEPIEMIIVVIAELLTAVSLIIGGYGLYSDRSWGYHVFVLAIGMLYYSTMANLGYSAQLLDFIQSGLMVMFLILNTIILYKLYNSSTREADAD